MACEATSTVRTGKNAKAVIEDELVLRLTQWTVNPSVSETAWGDSDGGDFTLRKSARRDGVGSLTGKFEEDRPIYDMVREGDEVKFALWESASDYWVFPCALVQNYTLVFDNNTKEVVEWSLNFGAIGRFYHPGESGAPVQTLPSS